MEEQQISTTDARSPICAERSTFLVYNIYIRDSRLNRHESVSLASLARQLYIARANFVFITRKEGGA